MVITSQVNAQQFQTPTLPGQTSAAVSQQLQSRLQYAEALKAQMQRAQQEQGAPSEFAQKAYEAQQAYQTQRAFDEYMAYVEKQKQIEADRANANAVADFTPATYHPSQQRPTESTERLARAATTINQAPSRPSTFAPPVHITPSAEPSLDPGSSLGLKQDPSRRLQQVGYQATASPQRRAPAQPLYQYQPPRETDYQPQPSHVPARQTLATRQQMIPPRNSVSQQRVTAQQSMPTVVQRQPVSQPRGYILQENGHEGLQDRISSMLSRPRYRAAGSGQPQLAEAVAASPIANQPTAQARRPVQSRTAPRQYNSGPSRQDLQTYPQANSQSGQRQMMAQANRIPQSTRTQRTRRPSPAVQSRNDTQVQYAFERQQRLEPTSQNRRTVQQATLLTPAQDPFNDQSIEFPASSRLPETESLQGFSSSTPPTGPDRLALASPPADDQDSMQQISVLAIQSEEDEAEQGDQFGQPLRLQSTQEPDQGFQPPADANSFQQPESSGLQSVEDQRKFDEGLKQRFQDTDGLQETEPSQIDERIKELERELEKNREPRDSALGDDLDDRLTPPKEDTRQRVASNLQNCDEIRNELLMGSIRDISLDMSPLASRNRSQNAAISRSWTDQAGNIVATGKMVDLRRGYVIIEGMNGRQKIAYAKLSDADWAAISKYWSVPELCGVGTEGTATRNWIPQTYTWKASSLCHKPLFFEDIQLERYGHAHGPFMQPVRSVAHFFVSFVSMPYQSRIHPAFECQYALGFYRPGDCAPWLKDPIPFSLGGAVRQGNATTGVGITP